MTDTLTSTNQQHRLRLKRLITAPKPVFGISEADVVVCHNEVCSAHGTGVLIERLFGGCPSLLSIRSTDSYGGVQTFGAARLRHSRVGLSRAEIFQEVMSFIDSVKVRNVVCIPWDAADVTAAIAVKEITGANLCVYVMDDQNLIEGRIPDDLMREALSKSCVRFAISPEMQHAYQNKYRLKFWLLPPLVNSSLIRTEQVPEVEKGRACRGVVVGNIWAQNSLDLLRSMIRSVGLQVDWFCNSSSPWLTFDRQELAADGLHLLPALTEAELARLLPGYAFSLIPSGTLDNQDDNQWVAKFSLPTRVPFVVATAHLPVIVLGSAQTASARFIERLHLGASTPYKIDEFRHAVDRVTSPESQAAMRENARRVAPVFSDAKVVDWLWTAMQNGAPPDLKFEKLLPIRDGDFLYYSDPPAPESVYEGFHAIYHALARIKAADVAAPDTVIDIGASTGIWSMVAHRIFPDARYILVEPLISRYYPDGTGNLANQFPKFEWVEAAVSNQPGKLSFQVSSDLYNSSLLQVNSVASLAGTVDVEVVTLDTLARTSQIAGRCMLKVDVQYAEHLVLEGGEEFIRNQVDWVALELTMDRAHPEAKTFEEMVILMNHLGFRYFDDVGDWRSPASGMLDQKDVLFVRRGLH